MTTPSQESLTYFGRLNWRDKRHLVGIKQGDRLAHLYVIGRTGTGKSTLLETMIRQDIQNGNGVCLIDPHGDLAQKVLLRIPENRRHDLIYFNVPDTAHPLHFNPLGDIAPSKRALTASNLISIFKTQWADNWGPRSEYIMRNCLLALLEMPSAQLSDITRLFSDKTYR